jgi:hypothetical protein
MERLETFFIHTVAQAQQQAMPTSGAVSTTQIGDFLAGKGPGQNVLDKLVASPRPQEAPAPPVKTEKVPETLAPQREAGKDLLRELTKPGRPPPSLWPQRRPGRGPSRRRVAPMPSGPGRSCSTS